MTEGKVTTSMTRRAVLTVECDKCGRFGRYHVNGLIERYGFTRSCSTGRTVFTTDCPLATTGPEPRTARQFHAQQRTRSQRYSYGSNVPGADIIKFEQQPNVLLRRVWLSPRPVDQPLRPKLTKSTGLRPTTSHIPSGGISRQPR